MVKRRHLPLLTGSICALLGAVSSAHATNYTWTGGNYFPTHPATLAAADTLTITNTKGTPAFNGAATFTNRGTVNQGAVNVNVANAGFTVDNIGTWDAPGSGASSIYSSVGGGKVLNTGKVETTGAGVLSIKDTGALSFADTGGTIAALGGAIQFTGANTSFDNTTFTGAGGVDITAGATFAGTLSSTGNALVLKGGTDTATGATLTAGSSADLTGGTLAGGWTLAKGSTLTAGAGTAKTLGATAAVTNNGTIAWNTTNALSFQKGSTLTNNGTITLSAAANLGAGAATTPGGTIVNNGLIQSTGTGTAVLGSTNVTFTNHGVIEATGGTIQLPNTFTNTGVLAGTSTISAPGGLTNKGILAPGLVNASGIPTAPGALTLTGKLTEGAGATLDIAMQTTTSFSSLKVNGAASITGSTLDVMCLTACNLAAGKYLVFSATGGVTGMFSLAESGFAPGTLSSDFTLLKSGNNIYLDVLVPVSGTPVPTPGTAWLLVTGMGALVSLAGRRRGRVAASRERS